MLASKVALGVDGSASNDGNHMLGEGAPGDAVAAGQLAGLITRGSSPRAGAGARDPGRREGAAARRHRPSVREWRPTWSPSGVNDLAHAGGLGDPVASLVTCSPARAWLSVIAGKVVVDEGQRGRRTRTAGGAPQPHRTKAAGKGGPGLKLVSSWQAARLRRGSSRPSNAGDRGACTAGRRRHRDSGALPKPRECIARRLLAIAIIARPACGRCKAIQPSRHLPLLLGWRSGRIPFEAVQAQQGKCAADQYHAGGLRASRAAHRN